MAEMYEMIDKLLAERGISGAQMSMDLGMSRSFMTELRKGRAKGIKLDTAQKIAAYFGVSVGYLLGQETSPVPQIQDILDEVDVAFYGEFKELDEKEKETVRDMVRLMRQRRTASQKE